MRTHPDTTTLLVLLLVTVRTGGDVSPARDEQKQRVYLDIGDPATLPIADPVKPTMAPPMDNPGHACEFVCTLTHTVID